MKRIALILSAILLSLTVMLMASCGNNNDTDTNTDTDTTVDSSVTDTDSDVVTEEREYKVTVKNQDGNVIKEVEIQLLDESDNVISTITTNENGVASFKDKDTVKRLYTSVVPEYHFSATFDMDGTTDILLEVIDNTPNGTVERPYIFEDDSFTVSLKAKETLYYNLYGGSGRTLTLTNAGGIKLIINGEELVSEDGVISTSIPEVDASSRVMVLTFENTSEQDIVVSGLFESPIGAFDNPYIVKELGAVNEAVCEKGKSTYFEFTATADGKLSVSAVDEGSVFAIQNLTTSATIDNVSNAYIQINEGETIRISLYSTSESNYAKASFTLDYVDEDAE